MDSYKFSHSDIRPCDGITYKCEICKNHLKQNKPYMLYFNKYTTNVVCRKCIIDKNLSLLFDESVLDTRKYGNNSSFRGICNMTEDNMDY